MSGSLNKVMLIGRLGADPEIRRTQDGRPIANLRLATSRTWRDRNTGERKEKTAWHTVVVFSEGLCGVVEQYMKKGMLLYVEGELQTRDWEDQQGQKRYATEVVIQSFGGSIEMLDKQGDSGTSRSSQPRERDDRQGSGYGGGYGSQRGEYEEDIPFAASVL
jgi:single-strand DNA-binding protein